MTLVSHMGQSPAAKPDSHNHIASDTAFALSFHCVTARLRG